MDFAKMTTAALPLFWFCLLAVVFGSNQGLNKGPLSRVCNYHSYEKACPEGCYGTLELDNGGNVTCIETEPGFYSGKDTPYIIACSPGYFQPYYGETHCFSCPAGTFSPNLAATECTECPSGYYQEFAGQSSCKQCDPTFYDKAGANYAVNGSLVLYENSTTVLYCGATNVASSVSPSTAPSIYSAANVKTKGATPIPSSIGPSTATPSATPSATSNAPVARHWSYPIVATNNAPAARHWSYPVVTSAITMAVSFVGVSLAVILCKRPSDKARPMTDNFHQEDCRGPNFVPVEHPVFHAFNNRKATDDIAETPPLPPVYSVESIAAAGFYSPRPGHDNRIVPEPPQGPVLVTPWDLDEELGSFPQEEKQPETSLDSTSNTQIVAQSCSPGSYYNTSLDGVLEIAMDSPDSSGVEPCKHAQRSVSCTLDDGDSNDTSSPKYEFSPMSGSSQV